MRMILNLGSYYDAQVKYTQEIDYIRNFVKAILSFDFSLGSKRVGLCSALLCKDRNEPVPNFFLG
jgi:hypothetical protein